MSEEQGKQVSIGDPVWVFDINVRKYRKDENGRSFGGPIWREHWRQQEIVGETRRSWITNCGTKIPKSGANGVAFSLEEIEREAFIQENRHRIADGVRGVKDYDLLKKIADLIGYKGVS